MPVVVPIAGAKHAPVTKMALAMCAEHPEQSLGGCCHNCNNSPVCTLCISSTHKKHEICEDPMCATRVRLIEQISGKDTVVW